MSISNFQFFCDSLQKLNVCCSSNVVARVRPPIRRLASSSHSQSYFTKFIFDLLQPISNDCLVSLHSLSCHLCYELYRMVNSSSDTDWSCLSDYSALQSFCSDYLNKFCRDEKVLLEMEPRISSLEDHVCVPHNVYLLSDKNAHHRNEDRCLVRCVSCLNPSMGCLSTEKFTLLLSVLDGHGGAGASDLISAHLPDAYVEAAQKFDSIEDRMYDVFSMCNDHLKQCATDIGTSGGTTCTLCVVVSGSVHISWVGDSEAYLFTSDDTFNSLTPFVDRPTNETERLRIESAGGFVDTDGAVSRVNGVLGVSRRLSDQSAVGVISDPHYLHYPLSSSDQCIIIASDGLWDYVKPDHILQCLQDSQLDKRYLASDLIRRAVAAGSKDNISVVVCWLL